MNIKSHLRMTASEIAMGRYMRAPDHPPAPDEFAAAFDTLAADDAAPPPPPAADDAPPPPPPAAEPPIAESPAAEPPAAAEPAVAEPPAAEPPAAEPPAAEPPAAAAPKENADDILNRLAAAVKAAPAAEPAPAAPPAAEETAPLYTEEEQTFLEAHDKEWGDMSRGEQLKRRAEYRALTGHIFGEIRQVLEPVREMVEAMAGRQHFNDIKEKVGEYTEADRENVIAWANEQPPYLQAAYKSVIEEGTAAEVADLWNRYREAKGLTAGAPPAADPPGGDIELSDAAKQAAAGLAPVDSKRSVVQQPDDASNYDAGWAKYSKTE